MFSGIESVEEESVPGQDKVCPGRAGTGENTKNHL